MSDPEFDIDALMQMPDEALLDKVASLRTPRREWAAACAILEQRSRENAGASAD